MRQLVRKWEATTDPAEREALAADAVAKQLHLLQSPEWETLADALTGQINDTLQDLARSSKDDEQNRGVIRALTHVLQLPENLLRAADAELTKHR